MTAKKKPQLPPLNDESTMVKQGENVRLQNKIVHLTDHIHELDQLIYDMRALLFTGKGFSNLHNLDELLEAFMSVAIEKYNIQNAAVLLKDEYSNGENTLRVNSYFNLPDYFQHNDGTEDHLMLFRFKLDSGLFSQIIKQGRAISVQDMRGQPRFEVAWQESNLKVLKSATWVPLIQKGVVIGVLVLGNNIDGQQIREGEYSFLEDLASIAAINIDSSIRYEKNAAILNNTKILFDINPKLSELNDFDSLCQCFAEVSVESSNSQHGIFFVKNEKLQTYMVKSTFSQSSDFEADKINTLVSREQIIKCANQKTPIRINSRHAITPNPDGTTLAVMYVPMMNKEECIGVICLINKIDPETKQVDHLGMYSHEDQHLVASISDQVMLTSQKTKLFSDSITDTLTGLNNTRQYKNRIKQLMQESTANDSELALLIVDIDHFKQINDKFGHLEGDKVIKQIGSLLSTLSDVDDSIETFRYGGEEFCILQKDLPFDAVLDVAERIRASVEKLQIVSEKDEDIPITISVGVASRDKDATDEHNIFRLADEALYNSKEAGRNVVSYHKDSIKTYRKEKKEAA